MLFQKTLKWTKIVLNRKISGSKFVPIGLKKSINIKTDQKLLKFSKNGSKVG